MAIKCAKCGTEAILWQGEVRSDYGTKGVVIVECGCRAFAKIGEKVVPWVKDTQVSYIP